MQSVSAAVAVAIAVVVTYCVEARADGLVSAQHGASGVSLSLYGAGRKVPAATVKIGRLTLGAQRRGFFRIGLLPLAQAEPLEIRFRHNNRDALRDLPPTFAALVRTDTIAIRGLAIYLAGEDAPALRAETAEIDGDEPWKLRDAVLADGTRLAAARLEISGAKAGRVVREGSGKPKIFDLFPANNQIPPVEFSAP